ncbi:hypothetical protein ZOSMA_159G00070 [Zostera marina]|uniref:Secreted protein n=1 Tax=Zostera marina TaxID=29655 RepID=A0A0K9PUX8_ZOSMR|nr:hypothetical protein ZOSMA_159G00070 [Zostera marina]
MIVCFCCRFLRSLVVSSVAFNSNPSSFSVPSFFRSTSALGKEWAVMEKRRSWQWTKGIVVLKQSPFAEAVLVAEKTTACPDLAFPEVPVSAPLRSLLWAPRRSRTLLPLRRFQMFLLLRRM